MPIEERLWSSAREKASGRTLKRFIRGIRYSLAVLDDNSAGLAFSFPEKGSPGEGLYKLISDLPVSADCILDFCYSSYPGERCAAVAVANALLGLQGDVSEVIPSIEEAERILMVGFIEPLYKDLIKKGIVPHVIDDHYGKSLPLDLGCRLASESDLLILSASSVVNRTWQELAGSARRTWLVGPTSPLCVSLYQGTSVEYVMGRSIVDILQLSTIVERGGGTRNMKKCTTKICLRTNIF